MQNKAYNPKKPTMTDKKRPTHQLSMQVNARNRPQVIKYSLFYRIPVVLFTAFFIFL